MKQQMKFNLYLVGLLVFTISKVALAQGHVHGQGTVFIAQQGQQWQIQYIIPAADALGFEHQPENEQQIVLLNQLRQTFSHHQHLMELDTQCEQVSYSHNFQSVDKGVDEHEAEHAHHSDDSHHSDIEVTYMVTCKRNISVILFNVFTQTHSLQRLAVQWSTERGQGEVVVTSSSARLVLP